MVSTGEDVTFTIEVTNQGAVTATNIQITDYFPAEFTLDIANATNAAQGTAGWSINGDGEGEVMIAGPLAAGASATVDVVLQLTGAVASGTTITNIAEISSAQDGNGNAATDIDSTPDGDNNDTIVGDNDISGDALGTPGDDEDDHDPASVVVNPFDLALTKVLATGQSNMVSAGDDVTFTIEITNQGSVTAQNIQITDYFNTAEFTLDAANVLNTGQGVAGWSINGDGEGEITIAGPLVAGATTSVNITMNVNAGVANNAELINRAEISQVEDLAGNVNPVDIDSNPDGNNDDTYITDNDIDGDGKNGGDEDDHDPASVTVNPFDLSLIHI